MSINPGDLRIKNLQPGEEVKIVIRRHWIALVHVISYVALLLISTILLIIFGIKLPIIGPVINVFIIIYVSIFLLIIYINWMRYELDLYIITTKRIIGLEELAFLNRHLSECSLEKVQEVNAKTTGLLSNLLDYGVVTIHTASEVSDFQMQYVPDALTNARIISNLISEHKFQDRKIEM